MRWAAFIVIFCFSAHLHADEPKPNTLTPKEIADGWILLFDGETTFGWQVTGGCNVADHQMKISTSDKACELTNSTKFGECELAFRGRSVGDSAGCSLGFHCTFIFEQDDKDDWTHVNLKYDRFGTEKIKRWKTGSEEFKHRVSEAQQIFCQRIKFEVAIDSRFELRDVKLHPINLKPIFNGKDLTGWKEFPGKKSKFSVTPEGWLQLKDGPGDLQTEALYDDFILQLECKTNGKNLNSGVFFRCRPGEYQQGYEAQIHNGFVPDKPKEYIVEEYDPKTNELKDKKKVKSPAIDYGTGAIYRRIPARKQTANDGEWFTMTVIAHGRHIATWVNGSQQVDWTDNRPLKDNARNGCRLEKGAISLQGHDPTTDLVFRNIRIAELPKLVEKK
jgi:hypothetical protein